MRYWEIVSESTVQDLDIHELVAAADTGLGGPAARAIDAFIGISADDRTSMGGVMVEDALERAYGASPGGSDAAVRQDIDRAFAPVRKALKRKFGASLMLYRHQDEVREGAKPRTVLSWTTSQKVARYFADAIRDVEVPQDDELARVVAQYERTGRAAFGSYEFVRCEDDPEFFDIYHNGGHVTDGDDLAAFLDDHRNGIQDVADEVARRRSRILSCRIPVDAIVWVSDRANQSEFIVRNVPGSPWYVDARGAMAGPKR